MKTQPLQKEILSTNEAAFVLGCDRKKVNRLCDVGLLVRRSNGKTNQVFMEDIRELLKNIRTYNDARWCKNPQQKAVLIEFFYQPIELSLPSENLSRN